MAENKKADRKRLRPRRQIVMYADRVGPVLEEPVFVYGQAQRIMGEAPRRDAPFDDEDVPDDWQDIAREAGNFVYDSHGGGQRVAGMIIDNVLDQIPVAGDIGKRNPQARWRDQPGFMDELGDLFADPFGAAAGLHEQRMKNVNPGFVDRFAAGYGEEPRYNRDGEPIDRNGKVIDEDTLYARQKRSMDTGERVYPTRQKANTPVKKPRKKKRDPLESSINYDKRRKWPY